MHSEVIKYREFVDEAEDKNATPLHLHPIKSINFLYQAVLLDI